MTIWRGLRAGILLLALLLQALPGLAETPHKLTKPVQAGVPSLVQIGVIDALLAGGYDGFVPVRELPGLGDLGLGTFDALDGELVLLDGAAYQVPFDGQVRRAPVGVTTPFAQVARLGSSGLGPALELPAGCGLKELEALLDRALGETNLFAAARVEAKFSALTARSVPRQTRPYRPLAEVVKEQALFDFRQVRGSLVGLRGPDFARGLGVQGWHWHFLTSDRRRGGHVLSLTVDSGQARLAALRRLELLLPEQGLGGFDLSRDRAGELKAVESAK